jgi:hypothetical protein
VGYFTEIPTKLVLHFLIFLRFSTQFTRISKNTNTISVAVLQSSPREELPLCNVAPGRRPAAVRPNSSQPPAGAGRARAGEGPLVLGDRFLCLDGAGRRPTRGGAGGQARWPPRPVYRWWGSMQGAWGGWRVRVGAGKGGGDPGLACSRPEVVARRGGSGGGHGWSAGARLGAMQGASAPFMGDQDRRRRP